MQILQVISPPAHRAPLPFSRSRRMTCTRTISHSNELFSSIQMNSGDRQLTLFPPPGPSLTHSATLSLSVVHTARLILLCGLCGSGFMHLPCSSLICERCVLSTNASRAPWELLVKSKRSKVDLISIRLSEAHPQEFLMYIPVRLKCAFVSVFKQWEWRNVRQTGTEEDGIHQSLRQEMKLSCSFYSPYHSSHVLLSTYSRSVWPQDMKASNETNNIQYVPKVSWEWNLRPVHGVIEEVWRGTINIFTTWKAGNVEGKSPGNNPKICFVDHFRVGCWLAVGKKSQFIWLQLILFFVKL